MAKVTCFMGKISGKVGGLVFRQRNGETFVSQAPGPRSKPPSEKAKQQQNKFTYVIKITKAVYDHPMLREIWRTGLPKKSIVYQKIVKHIHQFIKENLSGIPQLTPQLGFSLINPLICVEPTRITVITDPHDIGPIENEEKKKIAAAGIVLTGGSKNSLHAGIESFSVQSESSKINFSKPQAFVIPISQIEQRLIREKKTMDVLICLVILDEAGKPEYYSKTIAKYQAASGVE